MPAVLLVKLHPVISLPVPKIHNAPASLVALFAMNSVFLITALLVSDGKSIAPPLTAELFMNEESSMTNPSTGQ